MVILLDIENEVKVYFWEIISDFLFVMMKDDVFEIDCVRILSVIKCVV